MDPPIKAFCRSKAEANAGEGPPIEFHTALSFITLPFQIEVFAEIVPLSLKGVGGLPKRHFSAT